MEIYPDKPLGNVVQIAKPPCASALCPWGNGARGDAVSEAVSS